MKKHVIYTAAASLLASSLMAFSLQDVDQGEKLYYAHKYISQLYVDSVDDHKLAEDAIRGMLKELDPHSSYSTAEETRALNEPLEGSFTGIGISYNMTTDTLYVIETINNGPSERVGIRPGDRFLTVNDTVIAGVKMKNTDIQKRLRGPKGTTVDITALRPESGRFDTIRFTITRDLIPINSVDAAYMVGPETGFIRLNKFAAESRKEVDQAMKDLKKKGMKHLILDLTDNGGGYLNSANDILGEFLPKGELTVYTSGRNSPRQELRAQPEGRSPMFVDGRLVVMVNQYSASAAEILSGAVQDHDRGVIVGRRTFGKGLVQRPIPFPDGSMIRLTTAHYYTPTGRDIQKPYTKGRGDDYGRDILNRFNSGELMHQDSIHYADSLKVYTLNLHRPIYGGGGISPDVFVPLDTTDNTKYYRDVMAKGAINKYVLGYVDKNRKDLMKTYKNDTEFVQLFEVTPEMLQDLYDLAEKEGVAPNPEEAAQSKPLFSMVVKALIGRDVFDGSTYFKVYNGYDPIFRRALEIIGSDEYDNLLKQQ